MCGASPGGTGGVDTLPAARASDYNPGEMPVSPRPDDRRAPMTEPPTMSRDEVLRVKLELLLREHRDLDDAIAALDAGGRADQLTLRRLKKRKLFLKDEITRLQDEITPDIIA
jgi:hypothetical protein